MTDYNASTTPSVSFSYLDDVDDVVRDRPLNGVIDSGVHLPDMDATDEIQIVSVVKPGHTWVGHADDGPGLHFFNKIHHLPAVIELGNILSTVVQEIEIYNAWRYVSKDLTVATIDVDSGVSFSGLPSLPATIPQQTSELFDVVVTTDGPPVIDGTLDFTADGTSWSVAVTGNRVVMFAYEPETPVRESLKWLTDIIQSANGDEQRIKARKSPRQTFEMLIRAEEGTDRRKMMNLIKGWQHGVFGIPIWWEGRQLGTDASATDTTVYLDTKYADFRSDGLAILWYDDETFDALQVDSFNDTSITFTSPLTQDFNAGTTLVMPLRTCYLSGSIPGQRHLQNLMDLRLRVQVIDNDSDIADDSVWDTHESKVMLDEANLTNGPIQDDMVRQIEIIDNRTANPQQFSTWDASHPVTAKGFLGDSLQRVWEVRQLAHALNGSQVAFYLPTFYHDVVVTGTLAAGSFLMDIENNGYCDYINGQEPFKSLWIELTDGTIITKQVESCVVIDDDTERLTIDVAWVSEILATEINRISWLRLVRIADDTMSFEHAYPGDAKINVSIRGVQT